MWVVVRSVLEWCFAWHRRRPVRPAPPGQYRLWGQWAVSNFVDSLFVDQAAVAS